MSTLTTEPKVEAAPIVPVLIGGKWTRPNTQSFSPVYNPSTGETIGRAVAPWRSFLDGLSHARALTL